MYLFLTYISNIKKWQHVNLFIYKPYSLLSKIIKDPASLYLTIVPLPCQTKKWVLIFLGQRPSVMTQ